ncbi:MAG: hypothetical protein LBG43_00725 [Treponema sp.]|nr:hypothetical protein [Treponema sp.]
MCYIPAAAFLQGLDCFAVQGEEYALALKKLGATPIRMIAPGVFLEMILPGSIFIQGNKRKSRPLFFSRLFPWTY